jgi:hypothetical protein
MRLIVFLSISLSLLGCNPVKVTQDATKIRAITELDRPNCHYISNVAAGAPGYAQYYNTPGGGFEAGVSAAFNAVAAAGGDAYAIVSNNPEATAYEMEAWRCGWNIGKKTITYDRASQLREISDSERKQCVFIKTVLEGSNWGVTQKRNLKGAKKDALKHVQDAGGDSYYIVKKISNRIIVALIVEAWRCT